MSARRLPGARWRFLAHGAPIRRGGDYGDAITLQSDDAHPSVFDEVVVDSWLHVEQMDTDEWWMNVAGVTVWLRISRDGKPKSVRVYGPGDYDDPAPGCEYRLTWTADVEP